MNLSHIEHLGIAVKSLEEAIPFWENMLGLKCYNIEEVKEQKVRTAFFQIGQSKIELLESTDPEGPIGKFIEKKGEGMHHIAFEVQDIYSEMKRLQNEGFILLNSTPKDGADNKLVCFLCFFIINLSIYLSLTFLPYILYRLKHSDFLELFLF